MKSNASSHMLATQPGNRAGGRCPRTPPATLAKPPARTGGMDVIHDCLPCPRRAPGSRRGRPTPRGPPGQGDQRGDATALAYLSMIDAEAFEIAFTAVPGERTEDAEEEEEPLPVSRRCGALAGIFPDHGPGWRHFKGGDGLTSGAQRLYDPGHRAEVTWLLPERGPGRALTGKTRQARSALVTGMALPAGKARGRGHSALHGHASAGGGQCFRNSVNAAQPRSPHGPFRVRVGQPEPLGRSGRPATRARCPSNTLRVSG